MLYFPATTGPTAAQLKLLETPPEPNSEVPYQAGPGYDSIFSISPSSIARWVIQAACIIAGLSLWSWRAKRRHLARGEGEKPRPTPPGDRPGDRAGRLAAWLARTRFGLQLAGVFGLLEPDRDLRPVPRYILVGVALLAVSVAGRPAWAGPTVVSPGGVPVC